MMTLATDFRLPRRHRIHRLYDANNDLLYSDRNLQAVLEHARDLGEKIVNINGLYPAATVPITARQFMEEIEEWQRSQAHS